MLSLWYIILGWKEYNKPFVKADKGGNQEDPVKKPDLIPQKKDVKAPEPVDVKKPEPSRPISVEPKMPAVPPRTPEVPRPQVEDNSKQSEQPKVTPKVPEAPKPPKTPEFKLAPDFPKKPDTPKSPETPKFNAGSPKSPETPNSRFPPSKTPESPKTPEIPSFPNMIPSRRPEATMPDFPISGRNPAAPSTNPSEFTLPPYLPGPPEKKPPMSRDDELFALGTNYSNPSPNKPLSNLRDLSYPRTELPEERDRMSKVPKYMEHSVISNPDSLESDEDDE